MRERLGPGRDDIGMVADHPPWTVLFEHVGPAEKGLRPPVGVSRLKSDLVGALGAHIDDVIFAGIKRREGFRVGGQNGIEHGEPLIYCPVNLEFIVVWHRSPRR